MPVVGSRKSSKSDLTGAIFMECYSQLWVRKLTGKPAFLTIADCESETRQKSEWNRMPPKTKKAFTEMVKAAMKAAKNGAFKKVILLFFCLPVFATTNDIGVLTSGNQIVLSGAHASHHFVVSFESLETVTNIYTLLNFREPAVTLEDVPAFMPHGRVKMTTYCEGTNGPCSETNLVIFRILAPAPRVRLSRRYPTISPPLPMQFGALSKMVEVTPIPGGTNRSYSHRSAMKPEEVK